jgi:hypothetical protein
MLKLLGLIFFALAFLPSWTALSEQYRSILPGLYRFTGPLNVIKLALPFFLVYALLSLRRLRHERLTPVHWIACVIWLVGSVFTLKEAILCGFPGPYLREWFTLTVGLLLGILLSRSSRSFLARITLIWGGVLTVSILLDYLFPAVTEWLLAVVFDPSTRYWDKVELNEQPLTGVFGRQSLAKLLAWVPWLVLASNLRIASSRSLLMPISFGICTALILATSQRGPMLAMGIAVGAFWILEWILRRDKFSAKRAAVWIAFYIGAFTLGVVLLVPKSIWIPRMAPWMVLGENRRVELQDEKHIGAATTAISHVAVRGKIFEANWNLTWSRPWGNGCVPEDYYRQYLLPPAHSHSLWLEQAKQRGILFGLLHLCVWLVTGWALLRRALLQPSAAASALFAGWCAIQVSGLTDHLWQVLNHAMILGVVLAETWLRRPDPSVAPNDASVVTESRI